MKKRIRISLFDQSPLISILTHYKNFITINLYNRIWEKTGRYYHRVFGKNFIVIKEKLENEIN